MDNRQIWESAATACRLQGGVIANVTTSNLGFLSNVFNWYTSNITGASTNWGNRRVCAWVGATNIGGTGLTSLDDLSYTSELFWAEDSGAMCGAVS